MGCALAAIVLVHGIAQEQLGADSLEAVWLPALAGGIRNAGNHQLADQLWRTTRPGTLSTRMAYYGDYFLDPGSQGGALTEPCLLYTSDAADEEDSVDLGGG